jgi:hypothetical protein
MDSLFASYTWGKKSHVEEYLKINKEGWIVVR